MSQRAESRAVGILSAAGLVAIIIGLNRLPDTRATTTAAIHPPPAPPAKAPPPPIIKYLRACPPECPGPKFRLVRLADECFPHCWRMEASSDTSHQLYTLSDLPPAGCPPDGFRVVLPGGPCPPNCSAAIIEEID